MLGRNSRTRWNLVLYDIILYIAVGLMVLFVYPSNSEALNDGGKTLFMILGFVCVFIPRFLMGIYQRVWRYAGSMDYLCLVAADFVGGLVFVFSRPLVTGSITFVRSTTLITINLLGAMCMRLVYQYIYQSRNNSNRLERVALKLLKGVMGVEFGKEESLAEERKVKVAIVGAGSIGAMLAEELLTNPKAVYAPKCFVETNVGKVGRMINGLPIISGADVGSKLHEYGIQEVVFALPNASGEKKKRLYETYSKLGYKIKAYDYPLSEYSEGRRQLRDFAIEDLLYRNEIDVIDAETASWYQGKVVMITGGGGSIGSELARQIAKTKPSRLVLLDVYENGVYDVQQELKTRYGDSLNLRVEIANVCDKDEIDKIFMHHTPDIVLHAAAHKHVPLMERNVCEAVKNNVFGTLNVVETCEKYNVKRFIMISTDKAVNPTNVMGATKRMCEMIVQSRVGERTSFSVTRFGNVLGSNGSVIPLFKKQIANGGPITVTDKRITRYFMTIPEASKLVMISGVMAKNGELYVLDMGKPIKIYNLAEDMIRLSGLEPHKDIKIVESGLRPGEKLYEELLIKASDLDKTRNDLIFVERDKPLGRDEVERKLNTLRKALESGSNRVVKSALKEVIPTYHDPEEVNEEVEVA